MPEPKYLDADPSNEEDETPSRVQGVGGGASQTRTAWLSLFCEAAARDIVRLAVTTVSEAAPIAYLVHIHLSRQHRLAREAAVGTISTSVYCPLYK